MTDLVERYVHQVGRYLPPNERAEIEAELRSQIQDQLEDRYAGSPSPEDVASVLAEFGHPYKLAISYSNEKYLVGPTLYPYMMLVLRHVLLLVPAMVVFLNLFGALISPQQNSLFGWLIEAGIAAVQATLMFSAVLVTICQQVAQALGEPLERISVEMVFRAFYHYSRAVQRGESDHLGSFLAEHAKLLGIVKRQRKSHRERQHLDSLIWDDP